MVAPDDVEGIRAALVVPGAVRERRARLRRAREARRGQALAARTRRGAGRARRGDRVTSHALAAARTARARARPAGARRALPPDDPHGHVPQAAVGARGLADSLGRPHVGLPRAVRVGRFERKTAASPARRWSRSRSSSCSRSSTWRASTASTPVSRSRSGRRGWSSSSSTDSSSPASRCSPGGICACWYALAAFLGGIGLNAVYGVIQLVLAEGGINLDELLIEPITSRQTGINVFGAVGGTQEVFRPNALAATRTLGSSS